MGEVEGEVGACNVFFDDCLWYDNTATASVGGAYAATAFIDSTMRNCTIAQNSTYSGAAVHRDLPPGPGIPRKGKAEIWAGIVWDNFNPGSPPVVSLATQIDSGVRVGDLQYSCVTDLATAHSGYYNTDSDPLFVNAGSDDFHLQCGSSAVNTGHDAFVQLDAFDLTQDNSTGEDNPDLDTLARRINTVDMGCFELTAEPCLGDVNDSGTINTADLLAVIAAWGTCPSCPEDIAPGPCAGQGDGVVNVADLLLVIAQWGSDCGGEEEEMMGSSQSGNHANDLETITACMEAVLAENLTGEEFLDAFMTCLEEHGLFEP